MASSLESVRCVYCMMEKVNGLPTFLHTVFEDEDEAHDYCADYNNKFGNRYEIIGRVVYKVHK